MARKPKIPELGKVKSKPRKVFAVEQYQGGQLSSGGKTYLFKAGDYIVKDVVGDGSKWVVDKKVFAKSYEHIEGRFYNKLPTELSFIKAEKPGKIETLEGDMNYEAGDLIMTGVKGEQWPVSQKRFLEIYEII